MYKTYLLCTSFSPLSPSTWLRGKVGWGNGNKREKNHDTNHHHIDDVHKIFILIFCVVKSIDLYIICISLWGGEGRWEVRGMRGGGVKGERERGEEKGGTWRGAWWMCIELPGLLQSDIISSFLTLIKCCWCYICLTLSYLISYPPLPLSLPSFSPFPQFLPSPHHFLCVSFSSQFFLSFLTKIISYAISLIFHFAPSSSLFFSAPLLSSSLLLCASLFSSYYLLLWFLSLT